MAIIIKNNEQIKLMRSACELTAKVHEVLEKEVKPGITTDELNSIAEDFFKSHDAIPSFKNYRGYPKSICTSVNDEIIHGIPGIRKLKEGDIVSIDIGTFKNGYHGDAARTYGVGNISSDLQKLIDVTKQSFFEGIKFAFQNNHLGQISDAIQNYAELNGFSVVREYVGHGIGRALHEEPSIPNYKGISRGPKLFKGMTLAIEPMINIGTYEIKILNDKWTVKTKDGKFSAHYENTILITDGEPELLTLL
jgi:methionyl aminopeptidase